MTWDATPTGKRGRQPVYGDAAIQTCLTMKVLFGMALRQATGFVESLLSLDSLDCAVPDFSTQSWRQKSLKVNIPFRGSDDPLHLLVDSTGIKVEGEGEWNARKHGGRTLREALGQVEILTDRRPDLAVVDRGYRGQDENKTRVLVSSARRGLAAKEIIDLRRRSAIEAEIGHMKTDGRLSRCPLKGTIGDAVFSVLNACGHNIRKILAHRRAWLAWIIAVLWTAETPPNRRYLTTDAT